MTRAEIDLDRARAYWLERGLIGVPATALPVDTAAEGVSWSLATAAEGGLQASDTAADRFPLVLGDCALPQALAARWPHLAACHSLHLSATEQVEDMLTGQVALLGHDRAGVLRVATSLQIPGVLDDLYADRATVREQGARWDMAGDGQRIPTVTVWAPTARHVDLLLWDGAPGPENDEAWAPAGKPRRVPMARGADGCWVVQGSSDWAGRCYLFELSHVLPRSGERRVVRSTDPWSVSLTIDSTHSVLVDLEDPSHAPQRWSDAPPPAPVRAVDQSIYELHVRDFSRDDDLVPQEARGTYLAFEVEGRGRRHLRRLADAGLTTVHLLPTFDITSVPEDPVEQVSPPHDALAALPSASSEQQRRVRVGAARDPFNWGYDPWHFLAPEGSYAATPGAAHGGTRVAQFRAMVGSLHELGLRVVLDQVYNHTSDSGLHRASVLDRVVPGYYHRLDADGQVETSTRCQNVATEHAMAQKLMVDGCVHWVRHYRVNGFRFDLMGHHSRSTMEAVRGALDALTVDADGVDGTGVTLYGEGWNFGEVAGNTRFYQAVQGQLSRTGIGTFNDRLRDAVRGGSVHDTDPREGLGFATGGSDPASLDLLQVGLAGGLRTVRLRSQQSGEIVLGEQVRYGAAPGGYAEAPDEVVNYVDAHDNETLWDTLLLKLPPETSMAERLRRNTLALAAVTLSQGVSFWHAGAEILRSKSLDRNSYASGDWFNHLDYGMRDNGFGRGLPPEPDNGTRWEVLAPLLADHTLRPAEQDMTQALESSLDLLRMRRAHPLLRLGSGQAIQRALSFPVSGTEHGAADLVVMRVDGNEVEPEQRGDDDGVLLVLNAAIGEREVTVPGMAGEQWSLCAEQRDGADLRVRDTRWHRSSGSLTVPGLTAALLVRR